MKSIRNLSLLLLIGTQNYLHAQIGVPGDEIFSYYWLFSYDQSGNRTMRQLQTVEEEPNFRRSRQELAQLIESSEFLDEQGYQNEIKKNRLFVYPNPFRDNFHIELTSETNTRFKVFASSGQLLHEGLLSSGVNVVQTSGFAAGIYYLTIYKGDGTLEMRKLIKINE